MSRENVEIVRGALTAWNVGDMDANREAFALDATVRFPDDWPEPGPFTGRESIARQLRQLRETWDADALDFVSDFIDCDDRVVVRLIWRGMGHGPASNIEVTGVYTVRNGKICSVEHFWDHADALEAVGLRE